MMNTPIPSGTDGLSDEFSFPAIVLSANIDITVDSPNQKVHDQKEYDPSVGGETLP